VTDGYRNARVHRFTRDGRLVKSWGTPGHGEGEFHLPHSIAFDPDGKLYVADRANKRIQIFSPDGDFLGMWTGMGGPINPRHPFLALLGKLPQRRDAAWWIAVPRVKSMALPPTSKTGIRDTHSGQKFRGYPQRIPFVRAQMIEGLRC
jgi:hypothetical protein